MKITSVLLFFLLFIFSCGKKEVKKEVKKEAEKVLKPVELKELTKVEKELPKLVFTIQIAALESENRKLASLPNVKLYKENSLTKYRLGAFTTYKEARKYRKQVLHIYNGAFVQALKGNAPISITKALQ